MVFKILLPKFLSNTLENHFTTDILKISSDYIFVQTDQKNYSRLLRYTLKKLLVEKSTSGI